MRHSGLTLASAPQSSRRQQRLLAIAALLATAGGLAALERAVDHPPALTTVSTGSPLPALRGRRDDGTTWRVAGARSAGSRKRPLALVYVSGTCPHCHAELRRWHTLLASRPELAGEVEIVVVTAGPSRATSLPRVGSHVADPGKQIAYSLGVNVVPLTLIIDTGGVVRSVSAGETDLAAIALRLDQASGVAHAR